jgi:RNA polymerase sigma-70 factor, ECF subfamily
MRDVTLSDIERLQAETLDSSDAFQMDEDTFRAFYDRTARVLWAYLSRLTGDRHLADDLVQETYYRFLRAKVACETEAHRRNYLFRIATNLVHDKRRRAAHGGFVSQEEFVEPSSDNHIEDHTQRRADLARAMSKMKPRERAMLWLAYGHGSSHREIADALGLKTTSIKLLLFRARRKLAALLRGQAAVARGVEICRED